MGRQGYEGGIPGVQKAKLPFRPGGLSCRRIQAVKDESSLLVIALDHYQGQMIRGLVPAILLLRESKPS